MRASSVPASVVLGLLLIASSVSATYFPLPPGFKVSNNDALNNRVKSGDITRYVFLEDSDEFALGFLNTGPPSSFVPPNSTFYLSIITKPTGDPSLWNTVWSADRNRPVKENATLALDTTGNLVLTDSDGTLVWTTGTSQLGTVAALLDISGNLQLLNSANNTVWQSFDTPTDSLLPGQYLRTGNSLVAALSALSTATGLNYGSGPYSLAALPGGLALFAAKTKGSTPYYIQSAESQLHNLNSVKHTCLHPNNEFFDSSMGLVILTDLTKVSPAADPQLCGHGDSLNETVVIGLPGTMEGGATQRFVRIDSDGGLRLYQYSIDSRAFQVVGNVTATLPK